MTPSAPGETVAASGGDSEAIVSLVQASYPSTTVALIPLGCAGARAYVREQIEGSRAGGNVRWLLVKESGALAAAAEIRLERDQAFLNHICVDASFRGRGYGKRLLKGCASRAVEEGCVVFSLDVFSWNSSALSWYQALGFREIDRVVWAVYDLAAAAEDPRGEIAGLAEADAAQRRYGFSLFRLITPERDYEIGRLGRGTFRSRDIRILDDPNALGLLKRADAGRRLLILSKLVAGASDRPAAIYRHEAIRMTISLTELEKALS